MQAVLLRSVSRDDQYLPKLKLFGSLDFIKLDKRLDRSEKSSCYPRQGIAPGNGIIKIFAVCAAAAFLLHRVLSYTFIFSLPARFIICYVNYFMSFFLR